MFCKQVRGCSLVLEPSHGNIPFLFYFLFILIYLFIYFFNFCLSAIMCFILLLHISSLTVSSKHSNPIFILRTEDAEGASLHSPHSLWVDRRLWGNSPLIIVFSGLNCEMNFFGWWGWLYHPLRFQSGPVNQPLRGFPVVWKFLLL